MCLHLWCFSSSSFLTFHPLVSLMGEDGEEEGEDGGEEDDGLEKKVWWGMKKVLDVGILVFLGLVEGVCSCFLGFFVVYGFAYEFFLSLILHYNTINFWMENQNS